MTSDAKHTPGPWTYSVHRLTGHPGTVYADPDGADTETTDICELPKWIDKYKQESIANANLISAAPELLASLELLLRVIDHDISYTREEREAAEAAIAKAKGETP